MLHLMPPSLRDDVIGHTTAGLPATASAAMAVGQVRFLEIWNLTRPRRQPRIPNLSSDSPSNQLPVAVTNARSRLLPTALTLKTGSELLLLFQRG